jgi:hypothetical protein
VVTEGTSCAAVNDEAAGEACCGNRWQSSVLVLAVDAEAEEPW